MKRGIQAKEKLIAFFSRNGRRIVASLMVVVMVENPMTLNKYAYAGANPVMYADPNGYMFSMGL